MIVMVFVLLVLTAVVDLAVLAKLIYTFRLLKFTASRESSEADLPTVSVCISARNETHAMTQCLERVIASEYPKLEIIVLDDGSRDDTSLLIKSFAYAGVRFVEGKQLPDGWLGKNYAQSILADEASGKLLLFIDVDTLIGRHTISRLVNYTLEHGATMTSVVPQRNDHWQMSTLMTTMRHFWTLMRFTPKHPRAVSNVWLVDRQLFINQLESDRTLQLSMLLETTIARKLASEQKYRLIMSNTGLGIRYEKRWSSQVETSIRLLYPQCSKHWYQATGLVLLLSTALIPYVVVFWQPWALVVIGLQYIIAYYYLSHVWARYRLVGALLLPVKIIQEIVLLIVSAYKYTFGTVTWKGRPITTAK